MICTFKLHKIKLGLKFLPANCCKSRRHATKRALALAHKVTGSWPNDLIFKYQAPTGPDSKWVIYINLTQLHSSNNVCFIYIIDRICISFHSSLLLMGSRQCGANSSKKCTIKKPFWTLRRLCWSTHVKWQRNGHTIHCC